MPGMNMLPGGTTLQIPLDAPAGFTAKAGNAQVTLTWTDPKDKYATPEGETAQDPDQLVSVWDHTVLVRKTGSQPAGPNDGTVVVSSSVRDQYASAGYVDTGLVNGTLYYYAAYAYNTDGVASEGAFANATPIAGTPLGELAEGTLITIKENGAPVEFYVAKQNYEPGLNGDGRVLCVRKEPYGSVSWGGDVPYEESTVDRAVIQYFKPRFSQLVQGWMGTTTFESQVTADYGGTGHTSTLSRAVFVLSVKEYGAPYDVDTVRTTELGSELPISNALLPVTIGGSPVTTFTRCLRTGYWDLFAINQDGKAEAMYKYGSYEIQPVFTLPSTALVDQDLNLIET